MQLKRNLESCSVLSGVATIRTTKTEYQAKTCFFKLNKKGVLTDDGKGGTGMK